MSITRTYWVKIAQSPLLAPGSLYTPDTYGNAAGTHLTAGMDEEKATSIFNFYRYPRDLTRITSSPSPRRWYLDRVVVQVDLDFNATHTDSGTQSTIITQNDFGPPATFNYQTYVWEALQWVDTDLFSPFDDTISFQNRTDRATPWSNFSLAYDGNDTIIMPATAADMALWGFDRTPLLAGPGNDNVSTGGFGQVGFTAYGGPGNDNLSGSNAADFLYGYLPGSEGGASGERDRILGLGGNDTLVGDPRGTNYIDGGAGDDNITGGGFDDELHGGADNDTLNGGSGNDKLFGGSGDDTISGGDGNDIITDFDGNDNLEGGADNDVFNLGSPGLTSVSPRQKIINGGPEGPGAGIDVVNFSNSSNTYKLGVIFGVSKETTVITAKSSAYNILIGEVEKVNFELTPGVWLINNTIFGNSIRELITLAIDFITSIRTASRN